MKIVSGIVGRSLRASLSLALGLALVSVAGCSHKSAGCADLERELCAGKDDAFCERVKAALWQQTGPDRKPMAKDQVEQFCAMMADDKDRTQWVHAFQESVSRK